MFSKRNPGFGIVFTGHHVPGQKMKDVVDDGDSVTLHIGDERVLVRSVVSMAPGHYKGIIYGFEPGHGLEFGRLQMDQEVKFHESHIFGCG